MHTLARSTVFLVHAAADHEYALQLSAFLEAGCDVRCHPDIGRIGPAEHLTDVAEQCSGHLVLLLSKDSWPERIARERWDPLLLSTPLACVLINACPFPELLRRGAFFELRQDDAFPSAARGVKRWLWQQNRHGGEAAHYQWSQDLELLYTQLADRPGVRSSHADAARRFTKEAAGEFEGVLWLPCHGRSLVQATGELGAQLGLKLRGQEKDNRRRILEVLALRRCLMVLDAPDEQVRSALTAFGRSSTLVTTHPVELRTTPQTFKYAQTLIADSRLAEAYDLLYKLLEDTAEPGFCARELAWICEDWDRPAEAERLRQLDPAPTQQMGLFD